jgi:chemotaxis protein methyltransferase CheR
MTTLVDGQFRRIADLAKELWGLSLTERKRSLVSNRIQTFLRSSRFRSIEEYLEHLRRDADEQDKLMFFDALSTNVTSFFREAEAFAYLEREFYTPLSRGTIALPGRRIRIWSAGCSTGPEPYSLAIHAREHLEDFESWDFKILATDLSTTALQTARTATYPREMVERVERALVLRHFVAERRDGPVRVADHIRRLVTIGRVNLMDAWPFRGPFDVVFCRNVMIYFDKPTRQRLVQRIHDLVRPGGVFVIGSAETLSGTGTAFRPVQPSVYVK